jgi:hypothetical protein
LKSTAFEERPGGLEELSGTSLRSDKLDAGNALAVQFNISQTTISKSVKRGEMIAIDNRFKLINDDNVIKE